MKILYTFTENQEQETEEIETSTNEAGEKISVTKKIKKLIPIKFGLKSPTRSLIDDAQLFYGVKFNEGLKARLLTNTLVDKRINTDGGIFTEKENEEYENKLKEFGVIRAEYEKFTISEEKEKNIEQVKELEGKLMLLRKRLQELDNKQLSIYDNTAESYARNKTSVWWSLHLSLKFNNDKPELLFQGKELPDKLENWDNILESEDEFLKKICNKLLLLASFYHRGYAQNSNEFDSLLKLADLSDV